MLQLSLVFDTFPSEVPRGLTSFTGTGWRLRAAGALDQRQLVFAHCQPGLQPDHQEPVRSQQQNKVLEGILLPTVAYPPLSCPSVC